MHTYLYLVRKTYGNVAKENTFDNDKQKLLPLRHNNTAWSILSTRLLDEGLQRVLKFQPLHTPVALREGYCGVEITPCCRARASRLRVATDDGRAPQRRPCSYFMRVYL